MKVTTFLAASALTAALGAASATRAPLLPPVVLEQSGGTTTPKTPPATPTGPRVVTGPGAQTLGPGPDAYLAGTWHGLTWAVFAPDPSEATKQFRQQPDLSIVLPPHVAPLGARWTESSIIVGYRTGLTPRDLLTFRTQQLTGQGFKRADANATENAATARFTREDDTVRFKVERTAANTMRETFDLSGVRGPAGSNVVQNPPAGEANSPQLQRGSSVPGMPSADQGTATIPAPGERVQTGQDNSGAVNARPGVTGTAQGGTGKTGAEANTSAATTAPTPSGSTSGNTSGASGSSNAQGNARAGSGGTAAPNAAPSGTASGTAGVGAGGTKSGNGAASAATGPSAGPVGGISAAPPQGGALTRPVTTKLGELEVSVVPAGSQLPDAARDRAFALRPVQGATRTTVNFTGNTVFLGYYATSKLTAVVDDLERQFTAQGFKRVQTADDFRGDNEVRAAYKRGDAIVRVQVNAYGDDGFRVVANLDELVNATRGG